MKKLSFLFIVLLVLSGCPSNDVIKNEPIREKYGFFDVDFLYLDEMLFDISIPDELLGSYGYKSGDYAQITYVTEFGIYTIECTPGSSNVVVTLTKDKLTFRYHRILTWETWKGAPKDSSSRVQEEFNLDFNLIAAHKKTNSDNRGNIDYLFTTEDGQYGFIVYSLHYNNIWDLDVCTNKVSLSTAWTDISSFVGLPLQKIE